MSKVFNIIGGGSGGLSSSNAVIHVTAPAGSNVSFAKGGVVAKILGPDKSHIKASNSAFAEWYYTVSSSNYGEWTITIIRLSDQATESKTITISENKQYDLEIIFRFYLFREGYGLTVRDGSSISYSTNGASGAGGSSNLNKISLSKRTSFTISPSADITNYTLLNFNITSFTAQYQNRFYIAIASTSNVWNGGVSNTVAYKYVNSSGIASLDISGYSGSHYVGASGHDDTYVSISDIWLSR